MAAGEHRHPVGQPGEWRLTVAHLHGQPIGIQLYPGTVGGKRQFR